MGVHEGLIKLSIVFQGRVGRKWQALAMRLGSNVILGSPITHNNKYYPPEVAGAEPPEGLLENGDLRRDGLGLQNHGNFIANREFIQNVIKRVVFRNQNPIAMIT